MSASVLMTPIPIDDGRDLSLQTLFPRTTCESFQFRR